MTVVLDAAHYFEARARIYRHVWRGSVISFFLNPVMFLAAMGVGLGVLVDQGSGRGALEGSSYLAWLAPGLMAATTMQSAAGDSAWPVMGGFRWLRTYYAILSTPVRVGGIVRGHLSFQTVRLIFVAGVYALVIAAFGAVPLGPALLAVLPSVLTGLTFGALVMAITSSLRNEMGLSNLMRFGILPLFLFSGTFFPISQLPSWLEPVAYATPLWHGIELTRAAALDIGTTFHPIWHVAYLLGLIVIGVRLSVRMLTKKLIS